MHWCQQIIIQFSWGGSSWTKTRLKLLCQMFLQVCHWKLKLRASSGPAATQPEVDDPGMAVPITPPRAYIMISPVCQAKRAPTCKGKVSQAMFGLLKLCWGICRNRCQWITLVLPLWFFGRCKTHIQLWLLWMIQQPFKAFPFWSIARQTIKGTTCTQSCKTTVNLEQSAIYVHFIIWVRTRNNLSFLNFLPSNLQAFTCRNVSILVIFWSRWKARRICIKQCKTKSTWVFLMKLNVKLYQPIQRFAQFSDVPLHMRLHQGGVLMALWGMPSNSASFGVKFPTNWAVDHTIQNICLNCPDVQSSTLINALL